ncbi:MAG: hypothetical protein ABI581_15545 [Sediminibacterium sp.]
MQKNTGLLVFVFLLLTHCASPQNADSTIRKTDSTKNIGHFSGGKKLDTRDGIYFSSTFNVAKKNFPLSMSSIINKSIDTDIASKDFVWNIGLVYAFNKTYVKL